MKLHRSPRPVLALALAVGVGAALAGCGLADRYPLSNTDRPASGQWSAASVGEPIPGVVMYVDARPGDSIELIDAEALGTLDGAHVTLLVSRPILSPNGDHVVGDSSEQLEGAVIATDAIASASQPAVGAVVPGDPVGILAFIQAQRPGRYTIDKVRLRYRLNGGMERVAEGIDATLTVCAADPMPADCPEPRDEEPEEE